MGVCAGVKDSCECAVDTDCNDGNPCTVDTCSLSPLGSVCVHTAGNAGTVCRASAGVCDVAEQCDGANENCPIDGKRPTSFQCRAASDVCDLPTMCNGNSNTCPPTQFKPPTEICRPSAALCDYAERCTGNSAACPPDGQLAPSVATCDDDDICTTTTTCVADRVCSGVRDNCDCVANTDCNDSNPCTVDACENVAGSLKCVYRAGNAGAECRPSVGVCDVAEQCDGVNAACPADGFAAASVDCGPAPAVCETRAKCTGSSAVCPPNPFRPATYECRAADSGVTCDAAEFCTGSSSDCPSDARAPIGTPCDDNDPCTTSSTCQGGELCVGPRDACACESDADCFDNNPCSDDKCVSLVAPLTGTKCDYTPSQAAAAAVCRPAAGPCDVAERCDGNSITCPIDLFLSDVVCRAAAGQCDLAERCDGARADCPADVFAGNETVCRPADPNKLCDAPEKCDGGSAECPEFDLTLPFGRQCRAAATPCDRAEVCDGVSFDCPADEQLTDGATCDDLDECTLETVCRDGVCDGERSTCDCAVDSDCNDANDCTTDRCVKRTCTYEFDAAGTVCDDNDPCTIVDRCNDAGLCVGRLFCENDSKCLTPGPFCACPPAFGGLRCEQPRCAPPCKNGGECLLGNECKCGDDFEGDRCETFVGAVEPDSTPAPTPKVELIDIDEVKLDGNFWSQELGGGLYGWTVAVIFGVFLLLCIGSLVVVGYLLKHFIVDPVDKELDSGML